jgi:hypothetical protein
MVPVKRAVVVVAHPRSGTHITLDFIRRNFPEFDPSLYIWQSARELYVCLDTPDWRDNLLLQANRSDHIMMQSHLAGVQALEATAAVDYLQPEEVVFIYPFRRYSATMRSLAAFCQYPGRVDSFLGEKSSFFDGDYTVEDGAHIHGERWLPRDPVFLDIEALIGDPNRAAEKLGDVLGVDPAPLTRRLPRRRIFNGKMAEVIERLAGRESTEVKVSFEKGWADPEEPVAIDERFEALRADLVARSIV